MTQRHQYSFHRVVGTTAPSFTMGATDVFASTASVLESTALGRQWQGPSGRVVRLAEDKGIDFHVNFGTSTIIAASTDSMLVLGGTVEDFKVEPSDTYIAIKSVSTSTGAVVNITLGYGA
jgi:hypothetical protein